MSLNCEKCARKPASGKEACILYEYHALFPELICDGYWATKSKWWRRAWNLKHRVKQMFKRTRR